MSERIEEATFDSSLGPFVKPWVTWEYTTLATARNDFLAKLRTLGKEGWELAAMDEGCAYLKRPLDATSSAGAEET